MTTKESRAAAAALPAAWAPPAGAVEHRVELSLDARDVPGIVHLVQYDQGLQVIAAALTAGDQPYAVPADVTARVRLAKPDGKKVYHDAVDISDDRNTVYIEVSEQMTTADGCADAILELNRGEQLAGTAKMVLVIDKNPISREDIQSSDEYQSLEQAVSDARGYANAAAQSAASAEGSANTADEKLQQATRQAEAADASAQAAKGSEDAASAAQKAAADSEQNAGDSADQAAGSAAEAQQSARDAAASGQAAKGWSNLSKSYAIGEGAPERHPNEETDNAKYYAGQARDSAESAAGSVAVIKDNADAIQAVQTNLDAVLTAADNALAAQASAEDAATSAETAKEAADRAQSISQGALGYYAKAENLRTDHVTGENGQWAIVGETDTIWVWDEDTGAWTDSGNKTDLSQYYTKEQADEKNNELQAAITQETDTKLGGKQDKLTGTAGQTVGFDGNGKAVSAKVGTQNLLRRSRDFAEPAWTNQGAIITKDDAFTYASVYDLWKGCIRQDYSAEKIKGNTNYTFTCLARTRSGGQAELYSRMNASSSNEVHVTIENGEWKRYTFKTILYADDSTTRRLWIYTRDESCTAPETAIDVALPLLVEGSVVGDWFPAPEDTAEDIKAAAAEAVSHKWTVILSAGSWQTDETGVEWQGDTLCQYQDVACEGMTADTQIDVITFAGGDLESASAWDALQPGENTARLWALEAPAEDFTLRLTEVH